MARRATYPLFLACFFLSCSDNSPRSSTAPTPLPQPSPQTVTETFTLSAPDGYFELSHRLKNLGIGNSIDIQFKPLAVHQGDSGYSNVVEFWLDKLVGGRDPAQQEAIALVLVWRQGAQWEVHYYENGWWDTGKEGFIPIGGRYQTVTIRKRRGFSEWSIEGDAVLHLPDNKDTRVVYTRVVGTEARFQYESTTPASRALSTAVPELLQTWEGFGEKR